MDELEKKSLELKSILQNYDTQMFLGSLTQLMTMIDKEGMADSALGKLSSPMRQLYYLGGLLMTTNSVDNPQLDFSDEEWAELVIYLNEIESEYFKLFIPTEEQSKDEEWKKKCMVAMPSFLSYFNLGPLNYEEQTINWIRDVFTPLDPRIEAKICLKTEDFLLFYDSMDAWCQNNFRMFNGLDPENYPMRENWGDYTNFKIGVMDEVPEEIKEIGMQKIPFLTFIKDFGIKNRFKPTDLVTNKLSIDTVQKILSMLSCKRKEGGFLYYTSTAPANPLYETPIVDLDNGLYQVFEEKQVLHAISNTLEGLMKEDAKSVSKLNKSKGDVLEGNIINLFRKFFGDKAEIYQSYYVNGHEQDILVLWKDYAFVIEAKNYKHEEPFRNPEKAYKRIKQEFDGCLGYAYEQIRRVEPYFSKQEPLVIMDEHGNTIKTIDTSKYVDGDYYIIVNMNPFGQIQVDLSMMLELAEDGRYPWAVKYDDLEVFILTLIQRKKKPADFINFLNMREYLHGHVICSDELEICGGYITKDITDEMAQDDSKTITTTPSLASVFDAQYRKGMGFKNEKYWKQKKEGKTLFW